MAKVSAEHAAVLSLDFVRILRCPETFQALTIADGEMISRLNKQIAAGSLRNRAAQTLTRPLESGLLRDDRRVLYPIIDETPILLADEGIEMREQ